MSDQDNETANAVRYAVLQRLIPGIRHGLMGELQAIQYLAEIAERQLQASADSAKVRAGVLHIIYRDGVLRIHVKRHESAQPRRVTVQ